MVTDAVVWPCLLSTAALLIVPARAPVVGRLRAPRMPDRGMRCGGRGMADPVAIATMLDLLAACLQAGLPTDAAVRAVLPTCPAPLSGLLQRTADQLTMGADPATAWAAAEPGVVAAVPEFEALARLARRSARSGSSLAAAVGELAAAQRARVEEAATARAERAGVLIGGPLGLCFLPAFVCLGIVPVIIGLAGEVLGGTLL